MLSMPRSGALGAPHRRRHKKHVPRYGVCLFTQFGDSALQRPACKRVKSILGRCLTDSASYVHRAPQKGAKTTI